MMFAVLFLGVVFALLALRLLHLASPATSPTLYFQDSMFNRAILKLCPLLSEIYIPPLIWGKSGHIQTIIYGKMGRINSPFPRGKRISIIMLDGSTMTYDTFEPHCSHPSGGDWTLLVCPGIANHSESVYIQTYVNYAQNSGFRVAVLNHLGALKGIELTAPRMFTYGSTEEFGHMVDDVKERYQSTTSIGVGFSMGGNILVKYLGEDPEHQHKMICAMSCCQGYDIEAVEPYLMSWEHARRIYLWAMTRNFVSHIRRNFNVLFGEESKKKFGTFDLEKVMNATTFLDIDEYYSRRRAGFQSLTEYYKWSSSKHYINNVHIPLFIINSMDDPLVPVELHTTPLNFTYKRNNVITALTQHGGHLGFFEGGIVIPDNVTWLDKVLIEYANAVITTINKSAAVHAKSA